MMEKIYRQFLKSKEVFIDSRETCKGGLFFALKGENADGNKFAGEAIEKGAAMAIIDDPEYKSPDPRTVLVENSLETLQELAAMYRKEFRIPFIAVTGSNGKTTTKELMGAVLERKYTACTSKGNLNNHIGVPLSILSMKKDTEIAVIEMGANHVGEIKKLCEIARPTHGLITNIGKAHLEGFLDLEGVMRAKSELYHFLMDNKGDIFVNRDDELLMDLSAEAGRYTYGNDDHADVCTRLIDEDPFLTVQWKTPAGEFLIESRLYGRYNYPNIQAAIAVGHYFHVNPHDIAHGIRHYIPENSRSQIIETGNNKVLLDAYNANPTSMEFALDYMDRLRDTPKAYILGDMLELGNTSGMEHRNILKKLNETGATHVMLVGSEFTKAAQKTRFLSFQNSGEARDWLREHPLKGFTILVKGSRKIQLEQVLKEL
ncbi:MAG: UDP-N-acetylmuramoyl-tripeptide--D-alanyl-D-alanine ligase [Bacteroidales bacterium]